MPAVAGKPKGIGRGLATAQSQSLRVVTGAYKTTPVRSLETEAWVPPVDMYVPQQEAGGFQDQVAGQGESKTAGRRVRRVRAHLRKRRGRRRRERPLNPEESAAKAAWAAAWA